MIRNLRCKIVAMTMGVLVLMLMLSYGAAQRGIAHACGQITEQLLGNLAESMDGLQSEVQIQLVNTPLEGVLTLSKEELLSIIGTPLYGLEMDRDGGTLAFSRLGGDALDISAEESRRLQTRIENAASGPGQIGRFRYYKAEKGYGSYTVLANRSQGLEQEVRRHLGKAMIFFSVPLLVVMSLVSAVLAHFVAKPTEEAFKKQKQFVSDAGHELKTPLSTINVNAAVLESEVGPSKYMDCIKAEADRMDGLVRRLLDVARLEEPGKEHEKKVRFSLTETVYQATLPFESVAFERNIRYSVQLQENCWYTGDPQRIRQVVTILLDNAFKYGEEGGEVSVRLRREGRRMVTEVYNTGCGISKQDLPRIFERFYRCDRARTGDGSYGLGLAIALSIVRNCGGSIRAESQEGAWARFRLTL